MSDYYLLQDSEMCIGCSACQVHCKSNKNLGPGPNLCRNMASDFSAKDGLPRVRFVFMPCFHCEHPWCVTVCPTGAAQKRDKDGVVFIDPHACVGCKSCIMACPWGACQWDSATKTAVKCDYCKDRLDEGKKPACVTKCLTQCLSFGPASDIPEDRREKFLKSVLAGGVPPRP